MQRFGHGGGNKVGLGVKLKQIKWRILVGVDYNVGHPPPPPHVKGIRSLKCRKFRPVFALINPSDKAAAFSGPEMIADCKIVPYDATSWTPKWLQSTTKSASLLAAAWIIRVYLAVATPCGEFSYVRRWRRCRCCIYSSMTGFAVAAAVAAAAAEILGMVTSFLLKLVSAAAATTDSQPKTWRIFDDTGLNKTSYQNSLKSSSFLSCPNCYENCW